jgi:hypothetical protein
MGVCDFIHKSSRCSFKNHDRLCCKSDRDQIDVLQQRAELHHFQTLVKGKSIG